MSELLDVNSTEVSAILSATGENSSGTSNWMIYALFLLAGLFVGGAWSAYKNNNVALAVFAGVIAVVSVAGGVLWMIGEMT